MAAFRGPILGDDVKVLSADADIDTVTAVLATAECLVVDDGVSPGWRDALRLVPGGRSRPFRAILSTRTAYGMAAVRGIVAWAIGHGYLAPANRSRAESALLEAMANAIFHGNLGLPGLNRFGGDADAYFKIATERLADPEWGARPIFVTLTPVGRLLIVHVGDVGCGFRPEPDTRDVGTLAGRGRRIMKALAAIVRVSRGGRWTSLGFPMRDGSIVAGRRV
ncbi:MAG: hypothetical protein P4M00_13980 [Azospirillaceae bacterium]|nr:hypothetical protein [Azospirillaceae bacterium]